MSQKWTFQQIEGDGERKTLTLEGYNAPFGRPRKEPVLKEVIRSRAKTTRYPGWNGRPTRHSFGADWGDPIDLKGRWMTKDLVQRGTDANAFADKWIEFVRDERECRISWGSIVSYIGYIDELELARESENEIAWRMKIQIDTRDEFTFSGGADSVTPIKDDLSEIKTWIQDIVDLPDAVIPDMSPDLFASLDALAGQINGFSAEMNKMAGQFGDLEKATFSTIQHFRSVATGMQSAILQMRDVALNTYIDSVMAVRNAKSDILWLDYLMDLDTESTFILEVIAGIDRKAELAQRSEASKIIFAQEGDTWESLATRSLGGPSRAGDIRDLAGAKYGELPTPGEIYLIP